MEINQIEELNRILISVSGQNRPYEIFVDNLHTTFFQFEDSFILPSTSVYEVDFSAAKEFLLQAQQLIPELIGGCHILPIAKPKKKSNQLFLVKEIPSSQKNENKKFVFVVSFILTYLGGAPTPMIVKQPVQGKTATVRTQRIYFSARILPLESFEFKNGVLVDFVTRKYKETEFMVDVDSISSFNKAQHSYSELFDDVDYSKQISMIHSILNINKEIWKPGKIFEPIDVELHTISSRFLDGSQERIFNQFESFRHLIDLLLSPESMTIDSVKQKPLHDWLRSFETERGITPSGNMLWKILKRK
ncbi:LIC_10030 family protein [Leptospira borgpetersenii]|uniref:LIC_10030 family protein n=1 Tax=Leptospira borgpetersenii TaxID=174 RepID=UPI0018814E0C|nr:hypothetical protein [Leptospira borgpetersenii]MBE8364953.1 hypothetical protein [Leptospira borgpetersenii serovar Balcanica]MBE8367629.1 hypothetical protein [Leptospira borgpetersenii serovar Balcanica]MBE8424062.1 hypothetical protein [Leptospira borgpetersenii serovar Balcanica]MBF3351172.1 hypothetical protein [Leptospira borgpetersenii serovar Balcanica]